MGDFATSWKLENLQTFGHGKLCHAIVTFDPMWINIVSKHKSCKLTHIMPNLIFLIKTSIGVPLGIKWTNWKSEVFFLVYGSSVPKSYKSV